MPWQLRISRRAALGTFGGVGMAGMAGLAGGSLSGCDSGGSPQPTRSTAPAPTATAEAIDGPLRQHAVADERKLLAACAAPGGLEPFATLRRVHLDHLRVLTGRPVQGPPPAAHPPAIQALALAERTAATARRTECVRASPALAALLASLAASGDVANAVLLTP